MRRISVLAVCTLSVCLVAVLGGCTTPTGSDGFEGSDEIGFVNGYNATDSLDVDASDGLSEDELRAVTYRSMARIEVIRGLAFQEDVSVEIIDRETLRERWEVDDEPADAFTNEVWRAAFVVDGETDVNEDLDALYGESVQGYYSDGAVVIVADDPDGVRLDKSTFVHELVHALQDQHFGIATSSASIDEELAGQGLTEGEAEYLSVLYAERCETEWECVDPSAPPTSATQEAPINLGLLLSIYTPYSEGAEFVAQLHETGGWDAVDAAYDERPASTSQLVHPERYPDDGPRDVSVVDRSTGAWTPIVNGELGVDDDGDLTVEPRTETVGEATLFATLFANGVIDRPITEGATELSPFNYSHPATDGWAGDQLVAYEETGDGAVGDDAEGDDRRTGHVWTLAWESETDAEQFHRAYLELLDAHGAEPVAGADGIYRVPDDEPYAGAYDLTIDGDEVRIVGGPDVDALREIRAEPIVVSLTSGTDTTALDATAPVAG